MKKIVVLIMLFLLPAGLMAGGVFGELGIGYRTLADSNLSDVYGSGALNFSLGLGIKVAHPFAVIIESGYYRNGGKTKGLEEDTTFSYIPVMLKGRYSFVAGEGLIPYIGLGLGYMVVLKMRAKDWKMSTRVHLDWKQRQEYCTEFRKM